jgi:FAD/FMN-containing dehydrogenase
LYGLGADNFLEFIVVTADGEVRVANKVSNPDLFWALRGGGGSTFGVVLQATIKAHPTIPVTFTYWEINSTKPNSEGIWDAYGELHKHFEDFAANHGLSGYYYHYGSRMTGAFLHKGEHAGKAKAEAVWLPVLKKLSSFPDVVQTNLTITEYSWFKQYFDARFGSIDGGNEKAPTAPWDQAGSHRMSKRHGPGEVMNEPVPAPMANLDSRLLGARHLQSKNLTAALKAAFAFKLPAKQQLLQGHLVAGGKVHKPDDDNSVLPAWRTALTHVIGYQTPGLASVDSLRLLAPDSGAYANEVYIGRYAPNFIQLTHLDRPSRWKSTGRTHSGAPTTRNFQRSKRSTIQTWYSMSLPVSTPTCTKHEANVFANERRHTLSIRLRDRIIRTVEEYKAPLIEIDRRDDFEVLHNINVGVNMVISFMRIALST